MDRASAFVVAVSVGAVSYDRGMSRSVADAATAIAWEHSGHLPDDVPLHVLVRQFLEWQYGTPIRQPDWVREKAPAYTGPVDVGMRFTWAAGDPAAEALVDVTRTDEAGEGGRRRVWFRHADRRVLPEWERLDPNTRMVRVKFGAPCDEQEFRERVTPCT